jgi:hypothetical protein
LSDFPLEEGSPNACAGSTIPFSVAGYHFPCDWSVSKNLSRPDFGAGRVTSRLIMIRTINRLLKKIF